MAKNIRTSGNYSIQAGIGSSGNNEIDLNAQTVTVPGALTVTGNLTVNGTRTVVNSTSLAIEDQFIVVGKNTSNTDIDMGVVFRRGAAINDAVFYWNEGEDTFKAVTTTADMVNTNTVVDSALANIKAATPTHNDHVATRAYVLTQTGSLKVAGDDSAVVTVLTGSNVLSITGGPNIHTHASEPDTLKITLSETLTGIDSITGSTSNADITISANSTGSVVIDDVLTFPANRSGDPTATAVTKIFAQTPAGGGTGLYFNNTSVSSGAVGELISKKKATALAIALG